MRAKTPIALNLDDVWEVFLDHLRRQMEAQNPVLVNDGSYTPAEDVSFVDSGAHDVVNDLSPDQG